MDALVARDCSVLTPLVVCHAISRRSRALFSGLETPWCHCLSLASRQNWDRHAEQWVRIMVSRVGFRHIQHVRLNRSPTNRGQRMSGSIFKVAVQTYWALYGDVPQYLRQFTSVADIPTRQRLWSSTSDDLCVPAVRLPTVGRRAFSVADARIWNALPAAVTSAPSLFTFRKRLKLHLFSLSYPGLVH